MTDPRQHPGSSSAGKARPSAELIRWPPPGLERLQGDAWLVVRSAALASLILVLPLLLMITAAEGFATLGPLGGAWWVILVSTAVGLALALESWATLFRLLRRSLKAVEGGYGPSVVARVASDLTRDPGFLIQGARWYSVVSEGEKRVIGNLRVTGAGLHVAGMVWGSIGFSLSVLMAARGALTPGTMVWFTLGPAAVFLVMGVLVRAIENSLVRRARAEWFRKPWVDDLQAEEVRDWSARLHQETAGDALEQRSGLRRLRVASVLVAVLAAVSIIPPMLLVPTSAIGPVLTAVAVPRFVTTQRRAAVAEAYRSYRLPPAEGVDPLDAGEWLQELLWVGRAGARSVPGEREPRVRHAEPFVPASALEVMGVSHHVWARDLLRGAAVLDADIVSALEEVAGHPALETFSLLALAPEIDVATARWSARPADGFGALPLPRYGALRQAGDAQIARAILAVRAGRIDEAETRIREVISVGFLITDEAPMLIDNLIGLYLARRGGEALQTLFQVTGQGDREQAISAVRQATERAADQIYERRIDDLEASLTQLPPLAMDPKALRGVRWESFVLTNTLVPCLNLRSMVFGPGSDYESWVDQVRASLVRYPGEGELFLTARSGYFGERGLARPGSGLLGSILGTVMQGGDEPGSCAALFRQFSANF